MLEHYVLSSFLPFLIGCILLFALSSRLMLQPLKICFKNYALSVQGNILLLPPASPGASNRLGLVGKSLTTSISPTARIGDRLGGEVSVVLLVVVS